MILLRIKTVFLRIIHKNPALSGALLKHQIENSLICNLHIPMRRFITSHLICGVVSNLESQGHFSVSEKLNFAKWSGKFEIPRKLEKSHGIL